jgi:pentose-5-phosphate-3-epimerase
LDGAVNDKTLPIINDLKYKPDVVCPGSFLTKAKDLKKNVKYLNNYV